MRSDFINICSFGSVEFGYYEWPDGGCVDEYKVVVRYWDKKNCFLDEKILSYMDSPGEAVEVIYENLEKVFVFDNGYGKHTFSGGYKLNYVNGKYIPVLIKDRNRALTD